MFIYFTKLLFLAPFQYSLYLFFLRNHSLYHPFITLHNCLSLFLFIFLSLSLSPSPLSFHISNSLPVYVCVCAIAVPKGRRFGPVRKEPEQNAAPSEQNEQSNNSNASEGTSGVKSLTSRLGRSRFALKQ